MLVDIEGNDWSLLKRQSCLLRSDIIDATEMKEWQSVRKKMKGKTLKERKEMLEDFLAGQHYMGTYLKQVAVLNYINALKRAGLIKEVH